MKARTVAGRGGRRARYVTPDLSYELEGEREDEMCEYYKWDEQNKKKRSDMAFFYRTRGGGTAQSTEDGGGLGNISSSCFHRSMARCSHSPKSSRELGKFVRGRLVGLLCFFVPGVAALFSKHGEHKHNTHNQDGGLGNDACLSEKSVWKFVRGTYRAVCIC